MSPIDKGQIPERTLDIAHTAVTGIMTSSVLRLHDDVIFNAFHFFCSVVSYTALYIYISYYIGTYIKYTRRPTNNFF